MAQEVPSTVYWKDSISHSQLTKTTPQPEIKGSLRGYGLAAY